MEIVLPNNGIVWGIEESKVVQLKTPNLIFEILAWPQSKRIEDNIWKNFRLTQSMDSMILWKVPFDF